jgi:hypothetical protein
VLQLSALDEVIFSIPGVIDFVVTVEDTPQLMTVQVALLTVIDETGSELAAMERIGSINAVAVSRSTGRLEIKVRATLCSGDLLSRTGKRIVCAGTRAGGHKR